MFRVALITKTKEHKAKNFNTREEADEYILNNEATNFMISKNGIIIETDKGVRSK